MENFNALLTLSELKTLYSGNPVGICPLYKGSIGVTKMFETTGNPVVIPKYEQLEKLNIEFSPKQAGSGDPSPENVRPISGWDSVKVTVSDKEESHDYAVTLHETIYGGTVDAVAGVGSKEWYNAVFTGGENWNTWGYNSTKGVTGLYLYFESNYPQGAYPEISYCPILPYNSQAHSTDKGQRISGKSNQYYVMSFPTEFFTGVTSTEEVVPYWKSYLKTQYEAGTPVTICYKLATPTPFETSKISIPSLGSENTFFTNGENLDIIYKESSFWG